MLRYRAKSGAERIQTIGEYPTPWSLTAARLEAARIRANVDSGADPLQQRRDDRQELTVADVVDRFCKARCVDLITGPDMQRCLERDLIPVLGKRQLKTVKRSDIITLIEAKAAEAPTRGSAAADLYQAAVRLCRGSRADRGISRRRPQARPNPRRR
ncbi:MAG: integrase arm-type DNA-binding domain-containing protein [Chromatiales bacterium]|nr:integrase arm-type DNA-binding domain-containing protein [Chromatiales bacterium]